MNEIVNLSSKKNSGWNIKKTVVEEPVAEELPAAEEPFTEEPVPGPEVVDEPVVIEEPEKRKNGSDWTNMSFRFHHFSRSISEVLAHLDFLMLIVDLRVERVLFW